MDIRRKGLPHLQCVRLSNVIPFCFVNIKLKPHLEKKVDNFIHMYAIYCFHVISSRYLSLFRFHAKTARGPLIFLKVFAWKEANFSLLSPRPCCFLRRLSLRSFTKSIEQEEWTLGMNELRAVLKQNDRWLHLVTDFDILV